MRLSIRRAFTAILLLSLLGFSAHSATFVRGPYSGAPCADTVTVSWECEEAVSARVEYGLWSEFATSGTLSEAVLVPAPGEDEDDTCHVTLTDLAAGTEYAYRVVLEDDQGETSSSAGAFSTAPAPGTSVSFAVLADTQLQSEGINRLELVGDAIASDSTPFDFVLHAGDIVESPSSYYWDHWFASFEEMLLRAPFIPTLGNHEKNHRSYYEAFCLPPGEGKEAEQWWALHWGDVVVVGLDTNVKKASDFIAQQDWARAHLSGPEPHKFVIFHHPVFTSDAYHSAGTFLDRIYHPIFVETEVDIVFNGHSHHYEHIVRDGVTYLVVGGGGATPRQTRPLHIQGSDVSVERHFFYARVSTTADRIHVETVSVAELRPDGSLVETGELLDAFSLPEESEDSEPIALWAVLAVAVGAVAAVWLLLRALGD
jgi:predicted phosphodiesterase